MTRPHALFALFLCWLYGVSSQSLVEVSDPKQNLTYIGYTLDGVDQFQNIKFGQDTSGANRFKHPVPYVYPSGTQVNATAPGASCPQHTQGTLPGVGSSNPGVYNISEDCLNLRIARPSGVKAGAGIPVMIWIYGGSDEYGSDNYTLYDPTALVVGAVEKDTPVVFVAMNYRVNVFGFANNSALAAEKSQNSGLFDQKLAFDWVRDNIALFGGDPDTVTIFGQSDGATGVGLHIISYGGEGNVSFNRAILESDTPTGDPGVSGNYTLGSTITVASLAGCNGSDTRIIECMRSLPMLTLLEAVIKYENTTSTITTQDIFFPTIDFDFIPALPSELLREGRFHKEIPTIAGWAYNDGAIFTFPTINSSADVTEFLQNSYPFMTNETIQELIALYPIEDFSGDPQEQISPYFFQASQIFRDANYACGPIYFGQQVAKYGGTNYLYDFNATAYTALLAAANASFEGVIHTSEIPFVFNDASLLTNLTTADLQIQTLVSGSWAQFATTGNPNGKNASDSLQGWNPAFSTGCMEGPVDELSLRVVGGPYNGQVELLANATSGPEVNLLKRCAFMNTPSFFEQIRT